jgi:hypothetical protein
LLRKHVISDLRARADPDVDEDTAFSMIFSI